MLKFHRGTVACPKCEHEGAPFLAFKAAVIKDGGVGKRIITVPEHLEVSCTRCSCGWLMECADA